MKLVTYLQNSTEHLGVLTADETGIVPAKALGLHFADMAELAVTMTDRQRDAAAALLPEKSGEAVPLAQVKLLAPIPRPARDIICLGVNFSEHARESVGVMGQEYGGERKFPIYFAKHVNEAVAPAIPFRDTLTSSPIWTMRWKWRSWYAGTFRAQRQRTLPPMCSATPS